MNQTTSNSLTTTVRELRKLLNADFRTHDGKWTDCVHSALGRLAAAIQEEIGVADGEMKVVGEINPDFQNAPGSDRHIQMMRDQLIMIGEQVHQLRAEIRNATQSRAFDSDSLRIRCQDFCDAIAKICRDDNDFLVMTLNSNPGGGD